MVQYKKKENDKEKKKKKGYKPNTELIITTEHAKVHKNLSIPSQNTE